MTDVAFAAGFGSIRRFNETFRGLFGRAPSQLRRAGERRTAATAETDFSLLLRYQPPYDWPSMLDFLRQRAIAGVEVADESSYSRTFDLDGIQGTVTVRPGEGHALRASIRVAKLSALPRIIARLRRVFDLAADPLAIAAHLATDPALAPLVARRPGLRVPGAWDGFELAIRAVLGQQITVRGAVQIAARLVAAHGTKLAAPEQALTHVFPQPRALATADLVSLGMPRSRALALSAVAAAMMADPYLLDDNCSLEQAVQRLRAIRGVGEWTAQYIALRQLREPDAFPAADVGLLRALVDDRGRRPVAEELRARSERWRPWRAYAAQHLWASAWQPIANRAAAEFPGPA